MQPLIQNTNCSHVSHPRGAPALCDFHSAWLKETLARAGGNPLCAREAILTLQSKDFLLRRKGRTFELCSLSCRGPTDAEPPSQETRVGGVLIQGVLLWRGGSDTSTTGPGTGLVLVLRGTNTRTRTRTGTTAIFHTVPRSRMCV